MRKVICDGMLGSLAKWLRIVGHDSLYASCVMSDDEVLACGKKEKRVIITRDKELIDRCHRKEVECIAISSDVLDDQLVESLSILGYDEKGLFTRCTVCNGELEPIEKEKVWNRVPRRVFESSEVFWQCDRCMKMYWTGSHTDDICRHLEALKELLEN